jgi:hypothetical protein
MGHMGKVVVRLDLHLPDEKDGEIRVEPARADLPGGLGRDLPDSDWVITGATGT